MGLGRTSEVHVIIPNEAITAANKYTGIEYKNRSIHGKPDIPRDARMRDE